MLPKPYLEHADDNDHPIDPRDLDPAEAVCALALPGLRPQAHAAEPCMNSLTPDRDFVIGRPADLPSLIVAAVSSATA